MIACPSCGEAGIREHSVQVQLDALRDDPPASLEQVRGYSQCIRCDAVFRRDGPDAFVPEPAAVLDERTIWIVPPWKAPSTASDFEFSWDVTEAFYERLVERVAWVRPLLLLVAELRAAGFGATLRAGQSLSSLGLSRAREHGLRPEQSHLFLHPNVDGKVVVEGAVEGRGVRFGPVDATLSGRLRQEAEALARVEID